MIKRCKRLLAVRTRQHDVAHAAVVAAEVGHQAAEAAHGAAIDAVEGMLVRAWETSALERGTATIEAERARVIVCASAVAQAAAVQRDAAFARRRAEQALERARAEALTKALKREQTEHDERAARRRR